MAKINKESKAYLVGGGIASLSAAVYLIQEAGFDAKNICIFNDTKKPGGSLDAQYMDAKGGYTMRGVRMFEEKSFNSTFDLMARIPSPENPGKSLREVFLDYNAKNKTYSKSRLISVGQALEQHALKLELKDRIALLKLIFRNEKSLGYMKIEDFFSASFFRSNFWFEFCTIFAFEPWHSLMEFRRYFIRFIQDFPAIDTLEGVEITPYNQFEALVLPVFDWLKGQGLDFRSGQKVLDLDFRNYQGESWVEKIHYEAEGRQETIEVGENDLVISTLGSMVANTTFGSMREAPAETEVESPAWSLWDRIARKQVDLGDPSVFFSHIDKSKWISFTITCHDKTFPELLQKFIDVKVASFGGVNLVASNWLISLVLNYKPYFKNQPEGTYICWGYGLLPDKEGNFVKKKMTECSGEEIMRELTYHLGFQSDHERIVASLVCIPCLSPFVTSQFLPRGIGDRPQIVPEGAQNYAFIGQFCESPHDVVFTVDYSVRSAQKAVYALCGISKKTVPIYNGFHHLSVVLRALKTLFR